MPCRMSRATAQSTFAREAKPLGEMLAGLRSNESASFSTSPCVVRLENSVVVVLKGIPSLKNAEITAVLPYPAVIALKCTGLPHVCVAGAGESCRRSAHSCCQAEWHAE